MRAEYNIVYKTNMFRTFDLWELKRFMYFSHLRNFLVDRILFRLCFFFRFSFIRFDAMQTCVVVIECQIYIIIALYVI